MSPQPLDVRRLRAVLFDAVGTVLFADPPVIEAYVQVGQRWCSKFARAEIASRFKAAFAQQEELDREIHGQRTDEARELARWRSIVSAALGPGVDAEAALAELWNHFACPDSWRLAAGAAELFNELDRRQIVWGLASNFDGRLPAICSALPPLARSGHVFVSSELGWRKPSPNFFKAIEQQLGLAPDALLLVGDDLGNDYLAAQSAGWQAVLISESQTADCLQIRRLPELIGWLDRSGRW